MKNLARHGVQRALRHAQLYGYLVARHGRLFYPGGNRPLCNVQTSKEIVRSGWLRFRTGKYEITPEGLRALTSTEGQSKCIATCTRRIGQGDHDTGEPAVDVFQDAVEPGNVQA